VIDAVRDPRYVLPLALLVAIIVVSAVLRTSPSGEASKATPAATPAPVRTPGLDEQLLDSHRAFDLAAIAQTLEAYRAQNGAYPSTGADVQLLCAVGDNVGCVLRSYNRSLPASDGIFGYWYRSDGAAFTLYAHADIKPATDDCPPPLPAALAGGYVLCVNSKGGNP